MSDFTYRHGELFCEDIKISDIVQEFGTPLYIYSYNAFKNHFLEIYDAFGAINKLVCFSVKANSNLSILKSLVDLGAGLDIVSGGELVRALKAGCPAERIVFAGVGKLNQEIRDALAAGIKMFNVESWPELERINHIAEELGCVAQVSLRVNPDVDPKTHTYITTGKKENKFGLDFEIARNVFEQSRNLKGVQIIGIHCHVGSQITTVDPFLEALSRVKTFLEDLRGAGFDIRVFNFGGGLGIVYKDETPQTAQEFAQAVVPVLASLKVEEVVFEPGRYIAGNSGILVTEVQYIKQSGPKTFVIVDAAMNDLMRPALYQAYHAIGAIKKGERMMHADVVGPVCESGDFFAKDRELDEVKSGDVLAIMSAGAYGFTMSSNYNTRPRVAEVMVKQGRAQLIRKRETVEQLLDNDILIS